MNEMTRRLKGIIFIILVAIIIPAISFANNETNEEVQIVQINEGKCIIYIKGLENTEFNYALFLDPSATEMDLKYMHSVKDGENNQVALVEESDFDFKNNTKAYLKIKQGENVSTIDVDFTNAFTKENMSFVENTTKRIGTKIVYDLLEEDRIDENGVHVTAKVGGIEINDDENAQYFYELQNADGEYAELMKMAEQINNEYNSMEMFKKIKMCQEFYKKYNSLVEKANWQSVQNKTVRQPKESENGSKYVVFIKKVSGQEEITDIQFLTCEKEETASYENEKIVKEETTKLPITGESLLLGIALVVVLGAMVYVYIKMKQNKEERK